jgi:hypothetical protein
MSMNANTPPHSRQCQYPIVKPLQVGTAAQQWPQNPRIDIIGHREPSDIVVNANL